MGIFKDFPTPDRIFGPMSFFFKIYAKPKKLLQALPNFKNAGKLAAHTKIKDTAVEFFYLQKWLDTKTFFFCHDLLVSNAQGPGHSGLAT